MSHWIIVPIVLPALTAALLLLCAARPMPLQRWISGTATVALAATCVGLTASLDEAPRVYLLGNWPAPYGIVLVLDRLSALMLTLTAGVALVCLAGAMNSWDAEGPAGKRYFHALFQFQLMGLNGAFLTGDLFNLFVFFEVLLIASYGLLTHGGGAARARAGVHYVVINLTGSALFLVGVALLYGVAGTLNMADLARSVGRLEGEAAVLAEVAGLILLIVFGVKAALFPLYFWLPTAYTAAAAPVAALFALMTKVGVYAILRVFPLIFGDQGTEGGVAAPWLLPAGLITLGLGTLGALAATDFGRLTAYLTLASVGTLLAAVGLFTPQAVASALFYLVHSTLVTAALFLLWERVTAERGFAGDRFQRGPRLGRPLLLSGTYAFLAAAAVGLPPFSGFLGKVMILESARGTGATLAVWSVVLATGLLALFAVARAGSRLFWDLSRESPPGSQAASLAQAAPILSLAAALAGLVALASPFRTFTDRAAQELFDVERYAATVLRHPALPQRGLLSLPSEEAPR